VTILRPVLVLVFSKKGKKTRLNQTLKHYSRLLFVVEAIARNCHEWCPLVNNTEDVWGGQMVTNNGQTITHNFYFFGLSAYILKAL
jgi:hypothetical protein